MPRRKGSQNKSSKGIKDGRASKPATPVQASMTASATASSSSAQAISAPGLDSFRKESHEEATAAASSAAAVVVPVEQRWEESEGKYLHKKFKKMASAVDTAGPSPPPAAAPTLKHSALSMLQPTPQTTSQPPLSISSKAYVPPQSSPTSSSQFGAPKPVQTFASTSTSGKKKNICPFCQIVCAKPSVLDKHIRTHTNERPYPCEPCGFAFKTKSNLYKHCKSRTHNLKVEKGIDSSKEEIMAELGDSVQEEIAAAPPPQEQWPAPFSRSGLPGQGVDARLQHLMPVPPKVKSPHRQPDPEPPRALHPALAVEALAGMEQHHLQMYDYIRKDLHPSLSVSRCSSSYPKQPPPAFEPPKPRYMVTATATAAEPFSMERRRSLESGPNIRLPQHPTYPAAGLRPGLIQQPAAMLKHPALSIVAAQPTDLSTTGVRKAEEAEQLGQRIDKVISQNKAIVETYDPIWPKRYARQNSKEKDEPAKPEMPSGTPRKRSNSSAGLHVSSMPPKPAPFPKDSPPVQLMQVKPIESLQRPPDPAIPLNLASNDRRRAGDKPMAKPDQPPPFTASSIKELWLNSCKKPAKLNNAKQLEEIASSIDAGIPFHPQNPEGSMIKELLLKARMQQQEALTQDVSMTTASPVPVPKNKLLPTLMKTPVQEPVQQCNLCYATLSGVDLKTHQQSYCSAMNRARIPQKRPTDQKDEEVQPKRAREASDMNGGLLQITKAGSSSGLVQRDSSEEAKSLPPVESTIPGVPTPNISGVLTGIKRSSTLFSLPGKIPSDASKDDRIAHVPGMPGPYSLSSSVSTPSKEATSPVTIKIEMTEEGSSSQRPADGKFLRPSSLPLTPGSYKPKKHVILSTGAGATLVSPDTPRPGESCALQYQNGTAYTFLTGMKCSTGVYYTTISQAQPTYVPNKPHLSMYSNWKVVTKDSHPSKLSPADSLRAYNSTYHDAKFGLFSVATSRNAKLDDHLTHSSQWKPKRKDQAKSPKPLEPRRSPNQHRSSPDFKLKSGSEVRKVEGGYKLNEDVKTYVRGRGRGRYVCDSCGIRCKKPSMLKKHAKTHSNQRPYTCRFCNFAFKTKGNLTKHMKSKAHHKKCVEIGIVPVPTNVEDLERGAFADGGKGASEDGTQHQGVLLPGDDSDNETEDNDEDEDQFDDAEEDIDVVGLDSDESPAKKSRESDGDQGLMPRHPKLSVSLFNSTRSQHSPPKSSLSPQICEQSKSVAIVSRHHEQSTASPMRNSEGHVSLLSPQSGSKERYYFPSSDSKTPVSHSERDAKVAADVIALSKVAPPATVAPLSPVPSPPQVTATVQVPQNPHLTFKGNSSISVFKMSSPNKTTPDHSSYLQERAAVQAAKTLKPTPDDSAKRNKLDATCKEILAQSSLHLAPGTMILLDKKSMSASPRTLTTSTATSAVPSFTNDGSYAPRNVTMNVKDLPPSMSQATGKQPHPQLLKDLQVAVSKTPFTKPTQKLDLSSLGNNDTPPNVNAPASSPIPKTAESKAESTAGDASPTKKLDVELDKSKFQDESVTEIYQTNEEGKSVCGICQKVFSKTSQLRLHVNIHYFERPFRCDACSVSFRTKGHLQKHKRSVGHFNKVNINATFGAPSTSNPRPFRCSDCKIAFRIHGHLAKHLRSKMHIMKLECSGQLPIGMFAEMERLGTNLNEIDTSDCENSLESLKHIASKLYTNKDALLPSSSYKPNEATESDKPADLEVKKEPPDNFPRNPPSPVKVAPRAALQSPTETRSFVNQGSQDEVSTDSDTDSLSSGRSMKCQQCPKTFYDLKSLQIHIFIEHHKQSPLPSSAQTVSRSQNPFPTVNFRQQSPPLGVSVSPGTTPLAVPSTSRMVSDIRPASRPGSSSSSVTSESGDQQAYNCDLCGTTGIPNRQAFKQHLLTHAAPRPFVCHRCDAGFTTQPQLDAHMTLHQS